MPKIPSTAKTRPLQTFPFHAGRKAPDNVQDLSNAKDHVGRKIIVVAEGLMRGRRGKIVRVYSGAYRGLKYVFYDVEIAVGKGPLNRLGIVTGLDWNDFIHDSKILTSSL